MPTMKAVYRFTESMNLYDNSETCLDNLNNKGKYATYGSSYKKNMETQDTETKSAIDIEAWKANRSRTMRIYYIGSFVFGLLYSGYLATEYIYVKDVVGADKSTLAFSLVLGFSRVSAIVAALAGSIYYDFTLNVKQTTFVTLIVVVLGNILYVLPYSIFLLLFGNVLILVSAAAVSAIIAEVTHVFETHELTATLGAVCAFKTIGMLTGPCITFAFIKVDIHVNGWRLYAGNIPGIILGVMTLLLLCLLPFVKNLAKIYDLKAHREAEQEKQRKQKIAERNNIVDGTADTVFSGDTVAIVWKDDVILVDTPEPLRVKSVKVYFKTAFTILIGRRYAAVLLTSAFATYSHFLILNIFTVSAIDVLGWGPGNISYLRVTAMVGGLVSTIIVMKLSQSVKDYIMLLVDILMTVVPVALILPLKVIGHSITQSVLLYTSAFLVGLIEAACHVISIAMVGKIVQSEYQGIAEAVRLAVFYTAYALSGFGTGFVFDHLIIGGVIIIALNLICFFVLIYERKRHGL